MIVSIIVTFVEVAGIAESWLSADESCPWSVSSALVERTTFRQASEQALLSSPILMAALSCDQRIVRVNRASKIAAVSDDSLQSNQSAASGMIRVANTA